MGLTKLFDKTVLRLRKREVLHCAAPPLEGGGAAGGGIHTMFTQRSAAASGPDGAFEKVEPDAADLLEVVLDAVVQDSDVDDLDLVRTLWTAIASRCSTEVRVCAREGRPVARADDNITLPHRDSFVTVRRAPRSRGRGGFAASS